MRESFRFAIVGTGFIGGVHARAARRAGGTLAGVAASSPQRARAAAADLGAERGYDAAEELVEADGVDVVHICAPNHLHVPLAERALAAGKHVICEKPLALDHASARSLAAVAADSGLLHAVPFVYRYHPMAREARAQVQTGATGPLRLLHGSYLQDWLLTAEDDNWRVDPETGGASRAFADIGSHWCDLVEFVSGHRITRLSAQLATVHEQRRSATGRAAFGRDGDGNGAGDDGAMRAVGTEDIATVQFETDRGAVGSTVISQVSPGRKNRLWFELDGDRESLVFDQEHPELLWRGRRDASLVVHRDPSALSPDAARLATLPAGHAQGYGDCFDAFVAEAYAVAAGGDPPDGMPTFADGERASQVTDAVLRSARQRAWVEVGASVGVA